MNRQKEDARSRGLIVVPATVSDSGERMAMSYSVTTTKSPNIKSGIYGGRMIELKIWDSETRQLMASFDHGWILRPRSVDAEVALSVLLLDIDGVQYEDVK